MLFRSISQNKAVKAITDLKHLIDSLPEHRADLFGKETISHPPFGHRFRYRNNYWIFENYMDGEDSYKLDVFFEGTGDAKVVMWNTVKQGDGGRETVREQLDRINLVNRFNGKPLYNGWTAEFNLPDYNDSIGEVDQAVLSLVKEVFTRLSARTTH